MRIIIATDTNGDNIATIKEYYPIHNKGEISHFLMELEFIKEDLMDLWQKVSEEEDERKDFRKRTYFDDEE